MGILDQIVGGLMGGSTSSPLGNILMNMVRGGQQAPSGGNPGGTFGGPLGGAFGGSPSGTGGFFGGLPGLVTAFEQAGLGNLIQSWIGTGANQPVSPDQLRNVFGTEQVNTMASQSGMAPHDFLSQLSQHLPNVVNGVTPNGRMPDPETLNV